MYLTSLFYTSGNEICMHVCIGRREEIVTISYLEDAPAKRDAIHVHISLTYLVFTNFIKSGYVYFYTVKLGRFAVENRTRCVPELTQQAKS